MTSAPRGPASQTLSRGIRTLEILAEAPRPLSIGELAAEVGVHRSIAYRLLRTLEDHRLVARDDSGRVALGPRMAALAAGVARDLQEVATPELTAAANDLGETCFLAVRDHDECVTLVSVAPRSPIASVAQHPGARHPVTLGAPGKAILMQLDPAEWPAGVTERVRADVTEAARRGFATSHDEVIPTVQAVAVPLALRGRPPAALAAIHVAGPGDQAARAQRLRQAAEAIRDAVGG